jgi:hypothetical protein
MVAFLILFLHVLDEGTAGSRPWIWLATRVSAPESASSRTSDRPSSSY